MGIKLALSGGGIRGFAHIGVLQVIDELGLKVDLIAGVSSGALAASLYGNGYSGVQVEEIMSHFNWFKAMKLSIGKDGFISSEPVEKLFKKYLKEHYEIPTAVVGTDLYTGRRIAFPNPTPKEVRISCNIPILCRPIKYHNMYMVDGCLSGNLPIDLFEGCLHKDIVGVNVVEVLNNQNINNFVDIANRVTDIYVTPKKIDKQIQMIRPIKDNINLTLKKGEYKALVEMGRRAAKEFFSGYVPM